MRIQRNDIIAGVPALKLRNFFRKVKECSSFPDDWLKELSDDEQLADRLAGLNLIECHNGTCSLTQEGRSLCLAKCIKPLDRTRADKIFNEFMQRVTALGEDDEFLHRVKRVLLFGSYFNPQATDFGDIDIAVELERKFDVDRHMQLNMEKVHRAKVAGRTFSSFLQELSYSEDLALAYLKNRNRWISLHPVFDVEMLNAKHIQVYPKSSNV